MCFIYIFNKAPQQSFIISKMYSCYNKKSIWKKYAIVLKQNYHLYVLDVVRRML